eukprot:355524-Chlamydomonas_euryale.AAC.15
MSAPRHPNGVLGDPLVQGCLLSSHRILCCLRTNKRDQATPGQGIRSKASLGRVAVVIRKGMPDIPILRDDIIRQSRRTSRHWRSMFTLAFHVSGGHHAGTGRLCSRVAESANEPGAGPGMICCTRYMPTITQQGMAFAAFWKQPDLAMWQCNYANPPT